MSGFAAIGLYKPKDNYNIGSALRAAACYDASFVAVSGERYKKASTDVTEQFKNYPLLQVDDLKSVIPFRCQPVAIELIDDAIPLPEFKHPAQAFYIFGPEDGSLGKKITDWCAHKVYVPTSHCMNLAATVNVILYDRMAKERQKL